MERPVFHVVENNAYTPQPFVLTEVAICLRDAIRASGYPCEHVVNRIDPGAYSIVLGGSPALEQQWPQLDRQRCAIFNFEQLGSTANIATPGYRQWLRDWLVVDYHASNIDVLRRENAPEQQALELPIVPSAGLLIPKLQEKSVDVLFYGTLSDRRQGVIDQIKALGLSVEVVCGAYGRELAPAIQRARLVLHIHCYSNSLFPVARVLHPVAQGVPIVCEASVFSPMSDWSDSGIVFAPFEGLAQACADLLAAPEEQSRRVQQTKAFAARIDFVHPFEAVARALHERSHGPAIAPPGGRPLTNAEIEAILEQEAAQPPEAGAKPPELNVVRRDPGQGSFGKWMAWVLIAFIILGAVNAYR